MKQLLILIFFSSTTIISQTISRQVIGAAGKTQTCANIKMSFTSGETVVGLMSSTEMQLSCGYFRALLVLPTEESTTDFDLKIKVFPNPTTQNISISYPDTTLFNIQITTSNGTIKYQNTICKDSPIDVSNFNTGVYFLTLENQITHKKNTYKIIKK